MSRPQPTLSPVVVEVIRHRLASINEDAANTLKHVSGSQIAVEASDLNTVIMAADGRVITCGRYVLVQVASMHLVVKDLLDHYQQNPGIGPGDQFVTNDPYVGTLHQPDVVVAAPVFVAGDLVAWCASVVHQSDVGGPTPGSITYDARSIFDEAVPMAPMKLVEADVVRADVEREFLIRSRTPELNALDLAGQVAANRTTARQIGALCERYGVSTVEAVIENLLVTAERDLRDRLSSLPDGRWRHVAYVNHHDGQAPEGCRDTTYAVRLSMTKRGDRLEVDFSGSSDQAPGAINSSRASLVNFAMAGLLIYLCDGLAWVPGALWRVVDIVSRPGTVVHASWPAGVAMSTSSTGQAIRVCVNACVARMLEGSEALDHLVMASCQSAGGGACTVAGIDDEGRPFASMTLDDITGGGGARVAADGADSSGFTTSPGAACANVEVNESYLPVRYLLRRELADTGGPGATRGGVGSVQVLAPHRVSRPITVVSFGQGLQHPSAVGVAGGRPGGQSAFALLSQDEAERLVHGGPGGTVPMPTPGMTMAGEQVELVVSQGGGGLGDPLDRDPEGVALDVREGLVTSRAASEIYGVVLVPGHDHRLVVDPTATATRRNDVYRARLGGRDPAPRATGEVLGERFSRCLNVDRSGIGHFVCRFCGGQVCEAGGNLYEHLLMEESPTPTTAPFGLVYDGSEAFVLRHFSCPHCATQVDVHIARRDDPVLEAASAAP